MAVPRSKKDVTAFGLYDDDGTNSVTVSLEEGDVTFGPVGVPHQHVLDRGGPGTLIEGEYQAIPFSFTIQWTEITAASGNSVFDVVTGAATTFDYGLATATVDSDSITRAGAPQDADSGLPIFNIKCTVSDPGGGTAEEYWFINCLATISASEGMPNTFTISGNSYQSAADFMANIQN